MDKKVNWNPNEWAEKTKMLDAAERGVLADIRNTMFLKAHMTTSACGVVAASMDTWAVIMRMSTESVRKVFVGLEAAGVIRTVPKPMEAAEGHSVLQVECAW